MRKITPITGNYYHIFNRGVDKRRIFQDAGDFQKFYEMLYLFNDSNYSNPRPEFLHNEVLLAGSERFKDDQNPFVSVISYCLIANHFHLFLLQRQDDGISKLLHKLGLAYGGYFNKKYARSGRLFETPYKMTEIKDESHFLHLPRYIHLNPLDESNIPWRDGSVEDWNNTQVILDKHPWSSHAVYMGSRQSLPIVDVSVVKELFKTPQEYVKFLQKWSGRSLPCDLVTPDVT